MTERSAPRKMFAAVDAVIVTIVVWRRFMPVIPATKKTNKTVQPSPWGSACCVSGFWSAHWSAWVVGFVSGWLTWAFSFLRVTRDQAFHLLCTSKVSLPRVAPHRPSPTLHF